MQHLLIGGPSSLSREIDGHELCQGPPALGVTVFLWLMTPPGKCGRPRFSVFTFQGSHGKSPQTKRLSVVKVLVAQSFPAL